MKQNFFLPEMKFLLPVLIVGIFYFSPLYPVFAQNSAATLPPPITGSIASSSTTISLKENLSNRIVALKASLLLFKNQNKAVKVQRINDTLSQINQRRTTQMLQNLNKISDILAKLESKLIRASSANQDLSSAQNSITIAKTAIKTAQVAVASQSAKDYTISVSSESGVLADATSARMKLYNDLKTTQDLMIQARQAVVDATSTIIKIITEGNNATK